MGLADLGIMTVEELTMFARMICRAAGLPLIVDADTGYGGILNVMRVVRELRRRGRRGDPDRRPATAEEVRPS